MTEAFDIQAAIALAAEQGQDMSEASSGGGGYTPPNKGKCIAILVGYIELGRQKKVYQGKETFPRKADFIFELQGGSNPIELTDTGDRIAKRITVSVAMPEPGKQPNEKSGYYKLFAALNYDAQARHPSQLLGRHYLVDVQHDVVPDRQDATKTVTFAGLGSAQSRYFIDKPVVLQGDMLAGTQQEVAIACPDRVSALRLFLWDFPSKPMWDALFIEGEYPEVKDAKGVVTKAAKSKNVIQAKIRGAKDWAESPMAELLGAGDIELPPTTVADALANSTPASAGAASADPLAGL